MPTGNRQHWVKKAITCFLAQTYKNCELFILDDSDKQPQDCLPPRIFRAYDTQRLRLGEKRNFINQLAKADVIIHWDDDDWSAPKRIESQVAFLLEKKVSVVGFHSLLYWSLPAMQGYEYTDPSIRPLCPGSSLCYMKDYWRGHPFMNMKQIGEDSQFCLDARKTGQIVTQDANGLLVARYHGANTFKPPFGHHVFQPISTSRFPDAFWRA